MADNFDAAALPPMNAAPTSPAASQYRMPPSPAQQSPAPQEFAASHAAVPDSAVEGVEQNAVDPDAMPLAAPPSAVPFDLGIVAPAAHAPTAMTAVLPVAETRPIETQDEDPAVALGFDAAPMPSRAELRRGEARPQPPKGFKIPKPPKAPKPPKSSPSLGAMWGRKESPATASTGMMLAERPPLAALEADNISAWFGDHQVLDRVSLTMPAGVVTSLIGPSGCGKSTFLRILNRMHELVPSASLAGEVRLDGDDIYSAERKLIDARKNIGMVFQKPNPFPAMSIYDNVVAGLKLTGKRLDRDLKDELVETSLTKAGLWKEVKDRLRQPGGGLSGGQQQRLCIARSLAVTPRVLLMDEPCSALDPTSTRVIEDTMLELVKDVTIVIVTHNMQQAQRVSQQCAFFLASQGTPGVIVEHGDTEAMFADPIDPRTFDYVNGRFG